MAQRWILAIAALILVGAVKGDDLSDFSNNLASDIGPLLVLFGESMTRQYLSESTSFLDYFIFAMAPIGILTAVVSVIRVCGHPYLRAFIGRSQEGDGIVEAELCTSTSRDVCELFNRGGITRVLGRPSILELIYLRHRGGGKASGPLLFQKYLEETEGHDGVWKRVDPAIFGKKPGGKAVFAPTPNLSLNVGIKKQPDWVFFAVAAVGIVLQAGILALAGVGVWVLGWNLGGVEDGPSSRNYAPAMFIVGTIFMCGGMWSCAALIGQTTHELHYERRDPSRRDGRLIWLQPGPQTIGDQSFDPFAYLEKESEPLLRWTSSKKDFRERFELYTLFAVSAALLGYIAQFIGLRGMKAWVSLAQLGITVAMSILRGLLRMQRLGRDDNKLAKVPDLIAGYELDWLAYEIALQEGSKNLFWQVTGDYEEAISDMFPADEEVVVPTIRPEKQDGLANYEELLLVRLRLAHLTDHNPLGVDIDASAPQRWKDDQVKVRTTARKLSTALCLAAESLIGRGRGLPREDITLRIKAAIQASGEDGTGRHDQRVSVTLRPLPESTQSGWGIDSAQLEAILGLWMWSLVFDDRLVTEDSSGHQTSRAESCEIRRIVSAGPDDGNWEQQVNFQDELDLWLGYNSVSLHTHVLAVDKVANHTLIDLWEQSSFESFLSKYGHMTEYDLDCVSKPRRPQGEKRDLTQPSQQKALEIRLPGGFRSNYLSKRGRVRFCGWHLVHNLPERGPAAEKSVTNKVRLQSCPLKGSLLDICAQELFITLAMSLMGLIDIEPAAQSDGDRISIRRESPTVSALAGAFVDGGLGSHADALLCVVPALRRHLPSPTPQDIALAAVRQAEIYHGREQWEEAERLLRWACQRYVLPPEKSEHIRIPSGDSLGGTVLCVLGELYCKALARPAGKGRQEFGVNGIKWMTSTFNDMSEHDSELRKILQCYQDIAAGEKPLVQQHFLQQISEWKST